MRYKFTLLSLNLYNIRRTLWHKNAAGISQLCLRPHTHSSFAHYGCKDRPAERTDCEPVCRFHEPVLNLSAPQWCFVSFICRQANRLRQDLTRISL